MARGTVATTDYLEVAAGAGGSVINQPPNAPLGPGARMTLGCWAYANVSMPTGPAPVMTSEITSANGSMMLGVGYSGSGMTAAGQWVVATFDGGGSDWDFATEGIAHDVGRWVHLVGTIFIGGGTGALRLYKDGKLVGVGNESGGGTSPTAFRFMRRWNTTGFFDGMIQDAFVFHGILGDAEILRLYKGADPREMNRALVGYWPMDGTGGNNSEQERTGWKHATVVGSPLILPGRLGVLPPRLGDISPFLLPVVSGGNLHPPIIDVATIVYTPLLVNPPAFAPFIASTTTVYTPSIVAAYAAPFIASTTTLFTPTMYRSSIPVGVISGNTLVIPPRLVAPLANTVLPAVSGSTVVGQVLQAWPGVWTGTPPWTYLYQWQRDTGSGFVDIPGATSDQYILTAADLGADIRVVVTTAYTGPPSAPAASPAVGAVTAAADPSAPPGGYLTTGGLPDVALWKFVLCMRDGTWLADVSAIASAKRLSIRLNRPAEAHATVPSSHALVNTLAEDGYPYLSVGRRLLKVYRRQTPADDYVLLHNGIIWHLEDEGDENVTKTQFTSYDPMMIWRFRPVRDATGDFSTPTFANPISPGAMIQQMCANSIGSIGDTSADREGPLGLDVYSGIFDLSTPPGLDVSQDMMDWPITMADMHTMLTDTGGLDVWIDPVEGDADVHGVLNAVNEAGRFRPGVHFDYGMGDFSIRGMKRSLDMDTITNKLWYYLGPKVSADPARWKGSITGTSPGRIGGVLQSWDPEVLQVMNDSRDAYGVYMSISIYDTMNDDRSEEIGENTYRAFFANLWRAEMMLRAEPREMLFVTPTRNAPFDIQDIQLGDVITINSSAVLRTGFTDALQRVYGLEVSIDDNAIEAIEELVVSPE